MKIVDYDIIEHGIESEQYFQGCGTAYTDYEHCATGCGNNPAEAIDDCLENMAQSIDGETDWKAFEGGLLADNGLQEWPTTSVCDGCSYRADGDIADCSLCELHYYVSIRFNLDAKPTYNPTDWDSFKANL